MQIRPATAGGWCMTYINGDIQGRGAIFYRYNGWELLLQFISQQFSASAIEILSADERCARIAGKFEHFESVGLLTI
jgi:hypothetical protein